MSWSRSRSASSGVSMPSNRSSTSLPSTRVDATSRTLPPTCSCAPRRNRPGASDIGVTRSSPRMPLDLTIRPTATNPRARLARRRRSRWRGRWLLRRHALCGSNGDGSGRSTAQRHSFTGGEFSAPAASRGGNRRCHRCGRLRVCTFPRRDQRSFVIGGDPVAEAPARRGAGERPRHRSRHTDRDLLRRQRAECTGTKHSRDPIPSKRFDRHVG